jgi:hypothetical protein
MLDRFLNGALWFAVMVLISASAIGALLLSYHGLFDICAHRYHSGGSSVTIGVFLGIGSYLLARNANDLMDR